MERQKHREKENIIREKKKKKRGGEGAVWKKVTNANYLKHRLHQLTEIPI